MSIWPSSARRPFGHQPPCWIFWAMAQSRAARSAPVCLPETIRSSMDFMSAEDGPRQSNIIFQVSIIGWDDDFRPPEIASSYSRRCERDADLDLRLKRESSAAHFDSDHDNNLNLLAATSFCAVRTL